MGKDIANIVNALKRSEVFLSLEDKYLEIIASLPSSCEKNLEPGEILFQLGERAEFLYVLKEGSINLVAGIILDPEQAKTKLVVDRVTVGDFLGWSALVAPFSYVLTAVAEVPSIVICINGRELINLSNEDFYVGYKVFSGLADIIGSRLREYEQMMLRGRRWPFLNGNVNGH